jgi:hypothetical protein
MCFLPKNVQRTAGECSYTSPCVGPTRHWEGDTEVRIRGNRLGPSVTVLNAVTDRPEFDERANPG